MKLRTVCLPLALIVTLVVALFAAPSPANAASEACGYVSDISGTYGADSTNGIGGIPFEVGDFVTISVSLGTATNATFSIVGEASGVPVLAGPISAPGTLTYLVTGDLPIGSIGIGFYINSADGSVNVTASCTDAVTAGGPPIPAGFVLRYIGCDVAVFDTPGGQPVGDNRIKAGQTWYVNPKSVTAADGKAWTEVFVSGTINGYIPTSCVQ